MKRSDVDHRRPTRILLGSCWALVAIVLVAIGFRVSPPLHPATLVVSDLLPFLAPGLIAPAWVALALRKKILGLVSVLALVAATITIWPFDAVHDCRPFTRTQQDILTIYQANVLRGAHGGKPERYREDIRLTNPDVILLQEATDDFLAELDDGSFSDFSYRSGIGTVLWSRLPARPLDYLLHGWVESATIEALGSEVTIGSVHLAAPARSGKFELWERQLINLRQTISPQEGLILGGDFNASTAHKPFRQLIETGLTDVHSEAGCGMDATWPVGLADPLPIPPLLRLDHMLTSGEFAVVGLRVGPAIDQELGSDHHPIAVQLTLR